MIIPLAQKIFCLVFSELLLGAPGNSIFLQNIYFSSVTQLNISKPIGTFL